MDNALALPKSLDLSAIVDAFHKMNYVQTFGNSLLITLASVVLTIIAAAMCAYLFARKDWTINKIVFMAMVVSMIIAFPVYHDPSG